MANSGEPKVVAAAVVAPKRRKIQKHQVEIARIDQETPDTVTLWLKKVDEVDKSDPGDQGKAEGWDYLAGQFLTVRPHEFKALGQQIAYFEEVKGRREAARAYSLGSAPHEPYVGITVKEEHFYAGESAYPPLLSPFLVYGTSVGMRFEVQGFGGPYTWGDGIEETTDHIVHICSGSGVVPNYGLIKDALHRDLALRHTLIFGNKKWDDVIYREQLSEIAAAHPDKLKIVHAITREDDLSGYPGDVRKGRVTPELIREFVPDPTAVVYYLCGSGITKWDRLAAKERGEQPSPKFLEGVVAILEGLGVVKSQVHKESW